MIALSATILVASSSLLQGAEQALRKAVIGGDLKQVQTLIEKGADVNAARENGGTLLMDAAYQSHTEVVKRLLFARR